MVWRGSFMAAHTQGADFPGWPIHNAMIMEGHRSLAEASIEEVVVNPNGNWENCVHTCVGGYGNNAAECVDHGGEWLGAVNTGDTAWMLASVGLVFLQTPAIGITQAGMIRRKNSLSMLMQAVAGMAIGGTLWVLFGYSLVFSGDSYIYGDFQNSLLFGIKVNDCIGPDQGGWTDKIPGLVFVMYQCMFALMVPVILTGAWAEKLTFRAFVIFSILWPFLVYYPIAHIVWGGGFLAQWGVLDYAGGLTIHTTSGVASLVVSLMLTKREHSEDEYQEVHHNVALTVIGGTIIWFGWFGFNGGSDFGASGIGALALTNTHIAASVSGITWMIIKLVKTEYFHLSEILNGAFAGLAGVTPAAGYIHPQYAIVIGVLVGLGSYTSSWFLSDKLLVDDVLDVTSLQATSGLIGATIGVGLFASAAVNPGIGVSGAIYWEECMDYGTDTCDGSTLFLRQLVGALFCITWTAVFTWVTMKIVLYFSPELTEEQYAQGLDVVDHGQQMSHDKHVDGMCKAAKKGDLDEIMKHIRLGARPNIGDYDGRTAYHLAASEGHVHILEYLNNLQPDVNNLDPLDRFGNTPLADAIREKKDACISWIKENGGTLGGDGKASKDLVTKLNDAAKTGDIAEIKRLLSAGVSVSSGDYDGRTALHLAASEGQDMTVRFLVKQGANCSVRDRWGNTPAEDAQQHGHAEIGEFLANASQETAKQLCTAAAENDIETLKRIANGGADLNMGDYDKRTALHLAANKGNVEAVQFLLDHGCNPNVQDFRNGTPMDDARTKGHDDVVNVLRKFGGKAGGEVVVGIDRMATRVLSLEAGADKGTEMKPVGRSRKLLNEGPINPKYRKNKKQ